MYTQVVGMFSPKFFRVRYFFFLNKKQFLFLNSNFPPKPCQQKLWVFQGLKFASDGLHMIDYQQKIGLFAASKFSRLDFACELNYIQKKYHKHL